MLTINDSLTTSVCHSCEKVQIRRKEFSILYRALNFEKRHVYRNGNLASCGHKFRRGVFRQWYSHATRMSRHA